jgi:hypothetical protein
MLRKIDKTLLKFAAKQTFDPPRPQNIRGKRRVQSVSAEVRRGVDPPDRLQEFHCQPRGRVHRHIEGNQARSADRLFVQRLARQIHARHGVPPFAQPRRG